MTLSMRTAPATAGRQRQHRIAVVGATHSGKTMVLKLRSAGYKNIVVFDGRSPVPAGALGSLVRFGVEIVSATYQVRGPAWSLSAANGDTFDADIVIWANDGLDDDSWEIPGVDGAKDYMRNERSAVPRYELCAEYTRTPNVLGRNGRLLADEFAAGAATHLGVSVPGFPNLFLLAGPNSRLAYNPMRLMVEAQAGLVVSVLAALDTRSCGETEVARGVAAASYAAIQKQFADGPNDVVWPGSTFSYVLKCKRFKPADYCFGQR